MLSRKELVQCLRRTAVVFRLVNHSGWTSYELISGEHSNATNPIASGCVTKNISVLL